MSGPSDDLRDYLALNGLSAGFRVQFGFYEAKSPAEKYLVIKPQSSPTSSIIRRPFNSIILVGAVNSSRTELSNSANAIIESMRSVGYKSGRVFNMQASEPAFFQTEDARPVFELSIEMLYS